MVPHSSNTSALGSQGGQSTGGQDFQTSLANTWKPHLYQKYKISWARCCVPVIPATQEAEVRESFEPRLRRLQ